MPPTARDPACASRVYGLGGAKRERSARHRIYPDIALAARIPYGICLKSPRISEEVPNGSGRRRLSQCSGPHRQHADGRGMPPGYRSEEHTSELQSLMRISYAVFCLTKKKTTTDR